MNAPRAIASGTISFGLVSIPFKMYTAATSEAVSFNQVHPECGGRIKQQIFCPQCNKTVERGDLVKGYEHAKNQYVTFTDEEIKKLESEKTNTLDIVEFVPLTTVDLNSVEKSYYIGPDKGGSKAYKLLADAMERTGRVAVGRFWARGKEQLVLVRPYKEGLILHQVYYADEVRKFEDVDLGDKVTFKPGEPELADQLIAQLTREKFEPEKFRDEYRDRVTKAVEEKVAGKEITVSAEQPTAQIIDLFEALKASLAQAGGKAVTTSSAGQVAALAATGTDDASPAKGPKKAAAPKKGKKAAEG
jgi:DNA end-binding protein Ku